MERLIFHIALEVELLLDISIDENIFGLLIKIDAPDEGKLVLDLPRKYIDAEKQNGKDEVFIILIEKMEQWRLLKLNMMKKHLILKLEQLTINFEEGDSSNTDYWNICYS